VPRVSIEEIAGTVGQVLTQGDNEVAKSIIQYFDYEHLPPHLQEISKPFGELARHIVVNTPDGPEKEAGLRKLLECKDCIVRASV
jgi:hypothetical protein